MDTLDATVVVPTYHDWEGVQRCLDALVNQSLAPSRFEVVVANNNQEPAPPSGLRLPPNALIVHVQQPGSYAARNAALVHAKGRVVFFTDGDCLPERDWLDVGLSLMQGRAPLDRVAGAVEFTKKGAEWTAVELYDSLHWMKQAEYAAAGWAATSNLVVFKRAFDLVGPFRTDLYSGGDREWGERASVAGGTIAFAPGLRIRHPARATLAALVRKQRRVDGARFLRERKRGWRLYAPPLRRMLPSIRATRRLLRMNELDLFRRLQLCGISWLLRAVVVLERTRLAYSSRHAVRD